MGTRGLRNGAIITFFVSMTILLVGGYFALDHAPPIPEKVMAQGAGDLTARVAILRGQDVYQKYGLMDHGSIWGHGSLRGKDFAAQAEFIRKVTLRYWVAYIGIDTTGMGTGVAQLVRQFFPGVTTFSYSAEVKSRLVLKASDVIRSERLEFDAGWTDLTSSLMAIQKTMTASGRQMTYTAGRTEKTGHADLAWALLHALHNEPLEGPHGGRTSTLEIC